MRWTGYLCGVGVSLAVAAQPAWTAEPVARSPFSRHHQPARMMAPAGQPDGQAPGVATAADVVVAGHSAVPNKLEGLNSEEIPAPKSGSGNQASDGARGPQVPDAFCPPGGPCPPGMYNCGICDEPEPAPGPCGMAPAMIGAQFFYSTRQLVQVQDLSNGVIFPLSVAGMPVASRGPFSVAQNESPQPQDRVFLTYNWLRTVNKLGYDKLPQNQFLAQYGLIKNIDVHYETFGFEKAFFNNYCSVGVRIPFYQVEQEESTTDQIQLFQIARGLDENTIGDISIVLKGVIAYDANSGNMLSGGVMITAPTGPTVKSYQPQAIPLNLPLLLNSQPVSQNFDSFLIQPYVGYFLDMGPAFVHGFTSAIFPTESSDVSVILTNVGVGYLLCNFLVPTLEVHFASPLNHREGQFREPIGFEESIVLVGGVHAAFWDACTATIGASTPLSGENYDLGVVAQLNLRF